MSARIENLITAGTFSLDGGTWELENNVWIIGDDAECLVIDPAHDAAAVIAQVGQRRVRAVISTHGHNDHIGPAPEVAAALNAPSYLNPGDRALWDLVHPEVAPSHELWDGDTFTVAGLEIEAIHTPGHTPGSTCFYIDQGLETPVLFSGDTLFEGGPGATGRPFSNERVIKKSIRQRLFSLPEETVVNTGHGPSTTIGAEAAALGR